MIVNIQNLNGKALDWAVARATKQNVEIAPSQFGGHVVLVEGKHYSPSQSWEQAGRLIDSYHVEIGNELVGDEFVFYAKFFDECIDGDSVKDAVCKVLVSVQLGDEINVPDELVAA